MRRWLLVAACALGMTLLTTASALPADAAPADPAFGGDTGVVTLTGTVDAVMVDPRPDSGVAARTETTVNVAGRLVSVPPGMGAGLRGGQRVTVRVRSSDGVSARSAATPIDAGRVTVLSVTAAGAATGAATAAVASPVGTHTLTVLPVYWAQPDSATRQSLSSLATGAAGYWAEQSDGRIKINTSVLDWKQIANPGSGCNYSAIFNAALTAHRIASPASVKDHVMVYFPRLAACSWAGLGSINGSNIWSNGYQLEDVVTHEFGHNLGLGHANSATCTSGSIRVTLSSTCTVSDYADHADVMGSAFNARSGNLNTAFADYLGLSTTVTASASSRTVVDLAPLANVTATRSVRVDTPTGPVFIDFRPATGRDTRKPAWAGVQVHRRNDSRSYPSTELLDMRPGLAAPFTAASLPVNATWSVPDAGIQVAVTRQGDTARVEVSPVQTAAPALTFPANGAMVKTTGVTATWSAATVTGTLSGYRLTVNGVAGKLLPATATSAPVTLRSGANTLSVAAVTTSGTSPTGPTVTVVVDSTPPAAVTKLAVTGAGTLTWTAAKDTGTPVSYLVQCDGGPTTTVTAPPAPALSAPGAHTCTVTAKDAVGNASAATSLRYVWDPTAPVAARITAPAAGAILKATSATVSWTAARDGESGIAGYRLTVNGKAGATLLGASTTSAPAALRAGANTVQVTAVNQAGASTASETVTVTVDTTAPAAPTKLVLSAGGVLSWTAAKDTGTPVAFLVSLDGGASTRTVATSTQVSTPPGRHTWTVTAVDGAGNQSKAVHLAVLSDPTPPSTPVITSPTTGGWVGMRSVVVTWTASTDVDSGIAGYRLIVNGTAAKSLVPAGTARATVALADGSHTIGIVAVNMAGTASSGAQVTVGVDASAPTKPAVTAPKANANVPQSFTLTWTAATDAGSGISGYRVLLNGKEVAAVPAGTLSYQLSTTVRTNKVSVVAVNKAGGTAASSTVTVTGPVAAVRYV